MKRLLRIALVAVPLMTLGSPAAAEVKTRDKSQVKFESRLLNFMLGKSAKEGVEGRTAVKGDRKATLNDNGGTIVDLAEERVYELDAKKKTYTVTTFEELRRRMREAQEKAKKQAEKEEPRQQAEAQKPTKEYEVDFDVKDTGQRKQIAGFDARNTVATVTIREKGRTLEEAGGLIMTSDMWLGPKVPQMKEFADFDLRYAKALQPTTATLSAEQMSMVLAMFPLVAKGMDRMAKEGDKLSGTPLDTTTTFEAVLSKDQLIEAQAKQPSGGGGLGGLLAKKILKTEPPKERSTIFTLHHQILEVATTVAPADLAIPADFKEKK
jgi:hypothetical protein